MGGQEERAENRWNCKMSGMLAEGGGPSELVTEGVSGQTRWPGERMLVLAEEMSQWGEPKGRGWRRVSWARCAHKQWNEVSL
jgi:hypothetical protein